MAADGGRMILFLLILLFLFLAAFDRTSRIILSIFHSSFFFLISLWVLIVLNSGQKYETK